jgi:hypothetical protein
MLLRNCEFREKKGAVEPQICYRFYIKFYLFTLCFISNLYKSGVHAVAQLVEALRYKSEGRGFDSRWCHWSFY